MPTIQPPPLSGGATTDDAEALLRKYLSPALRGSAWDALIAAVASSDAYNSQLAQSAYDQLFITSAEGIYLDRLCTDRGVARPPSVGLSNDAYRKLSIKTTTRQLVRQVLLEALEIYYGPDATRAHAISGVNGPYSIEEGDDLFIEIDGGTALQVVFEEDDFVDPNEATAVEVAAAVTRAFRNANSTASAQGLTDPSTGNTEFRIYSGSLGIAGSVRVIGGKAQNVFLFPTQLDTTQSATTAWDVDPATASNGIKAGRVRYTWTGGTDPSLVLVNVGDYANIYGSPLDPDNQGTFEIVATAPTYFEIENTAGAEESVVQTASDDIFFFAPTKRTIQRTGRMATVIQGGNGGIDVILPATTQVIERTENTGAYLNANPATNITALARNSAGLVTVTSVDHGMVTGQWAEIDDVIPNNAIVSSSAWTDSDVAAAVTSQNYPGMAVLGDGDVLLGGGGTTDSYLYDAEAGTWSAAATMFATSELGQFTTLQSGKVLCSGGSVTTTTCQLYDPDSNTWTETGPTSLYHSDYTATLLNNGKVLVVGGHDATAIAELYDPATGSWTTAATPSTYRQGHIAALLNDGRVLVAGGFAASTLDTAEVYNPINNTWATAGILNDPRRDAAAVVLTVGPNKGRVLVAGGTDDAANGVATVEIFNPSTMTWSAGTSMSVARFQHAASVRLNGEVVVSGGTTTSVGSPLSSTEVYNPISGTWSTGPALLLAHKQHRSVALPAIGKILIAGQTTTSPELLSFPTTVAGGRLNGLFKVTRLTDDTFTYITPDAPYVTTGLAAGSVRPIAHPDANQNGPFIFDPDAGLAITDTDASLNEDILATQTYKTLAITGADALPDEEGYLVLGFGTTEETQVHYLGRISSTEILLDPGFAFPVDIASGASVLLLKQRGPFVPENPEEVGAFYLTASSAGRVAASSTIDDIVGAGLLVNKTVVYPGDRGLGNEGYPSSGATKLSDKVVVWAGDDIDTELDEAREE